MDDGAEALSRLQQKLDKTRAAALAVSRVEGPDVFAQLAEQMAGILGVSATLIATPIPSRPGSVRTLATCVDGRLLPPFEYDLQGSPCRGVTGRESRFVGSGVNGEFTPGSMFQAKGFDSYAARSLVDAQGQHLGLIVAMDRAPMHDQSLVEALMQIFAVRAAAELERERSDAALRTSEASYRSLFEANEDAVFIHDWDTGAILDVSPKASEMYGYPREELQTLRVGDISANVPPYTERDAIARIEEAKKSADTLRFEWNGRHRDGHLMWHEVTLKRAEIAGERRVLAFVRDITASKLAEEAVRASEEQYRAIFEAATDSLQLLDAQHRVVDVNPAYERMYDRRREEVIGKTLAELVPAPFREERRALVDRALAGDAAELQTTAFRRDGTAFDLEVRVIPFQHRGQAHVLGIARDITERKRAEAALRLREEQYRVIFDGSADAIALWDRDLRIVDVNEAFTQLYGYSRAEAINRSFASRISEEGRELRTRMIRRALAGRVGQLETEGVKKSGEKFDVELRYLPIVHRGEPHVLAIGRDVSARRRAEEALRASEEQYRAIFNASVDAMVLWDSGLRRVDINPAYGRLFGVTREQVLNGTAFEHQSFEYLEKRRDLVRRTLAGESCHAVLKSISRDGRVLDIEVRTTPIRHRGEPHVLAIARDVTELKQAEDALRSSEEQYRAIFNASVDGLLLWDRDHRVVDVNRAFLTMHGYERLDAAELADADFIPPGLRSQCADLLPEILDGTPCHLEARSRRRDGSEFDVEVHGVRMEYRGQPHVLVIVRDIGDRRRAETALRDSEEQYREIFNSSADALVLRAADFSIVDVNATYEAMSGYRREDVIGVDRVLANPLEVAKTIRGLHERALAGEPILFETQLVRRDGTRYELELRGVPVLHRGEKHVLYMGRDVTARRRAEGQRRELESQLLQAQKMEAIGHLTGGIAHDFNNVLASIMGNTGLALERPAVNGDPRLGDYLEQVQKACRRARELIQQMLEFSRGGRGEPRVLSLPNVVREALPMLRSMIPATLNIVVEAEAAPPVFINEVQAHQVLLNLAINARDAMPGGGAIRIRVRQFETAGAVCASCHRPIEGRYVELSVADSGAGIEGDLLERIFDPFFTTKDPDKGTGMGLATVHGIVHQHSGHLIVDTVPGCGTTFRVLFPVHAGDVPETAVVRERATGAAHLSGRILLVDDEPSVLAVMQKTLESLGLEVDAVSSADAAERAFARDPDGFDLLVTDHAMPMVSGIELAHRLRSRRPGLPWLLYTGYADEAMLASARSLEVGAVLRKPVEKDDLHRELERILSHSATATRS